MLLRSMVFEILKYKWLWLKANPAVKMISPPEWLLRDILTQFSLSLDETERKAILTDFRQFAQTA